MQIFFNKSYYSTRPSVVGCICRWGTVNTGLDYKFILGFLTGGEGDVSVPNVHIVQRSTVNVSLNFVSCSSKLLKLRRGSWDPLPPQFIASHNYRGQSGICDWHLKWAEVL